MSINFAQNQNNIKYITAQINYSIKMKFNGLDFNPIESDGTSIRPITYNGRTYLPLRALSEKLGVAVDWDQNTQTVILGEREKVLDVNNFLGNSYNEYTTDSDLLYMNSASFDCGYVGEHICLTLNTKGKFQKIGFEVGFIDHNSKSSDPHTINIWNEDSRVLLHRKELYQGENYKAEVNIKGAQKITISSEGNDVEKFVLGNPYFK